MTAYRAPERTAPGVAPHAASVTALRRAAEQATFAPSVHNTQPWRFILEPTRLTLLADQTRRLRALDASRRELIVSCGCALFNARVSLAADGWGPDIVEFPEGADAEMLAYLDLRMPRPPTAELAALGPLLSLRRTNRRRFADDEVPPDIVETLQRAASAEHAALLEIRRDDHRDLVASRSQQADALQNTDPAYRAETRSSRRQCLLLLCADRDEPRSWLRAGQALERVLLEVTRHGLAASPLAQVVEVPAVRAALRRDLDLRGYPIVLLRVGRAAFTPGTLRRELADVLIDLS